MGLEVTPMQATTPDDDGDWIVRPTPLAAAMHATPFPDFGERCDAKAAVHDLTVNQIRRLVEAER